MPDTFPLRAYAIAFVELAERFSYYGTTIVVRPAALASALSI